MASSTTIRGTTEFSLTLRQRSIGILRIAFGVAWAVAAWLKWQPAFINGFTDFMKSAMDGQPQLLHTWIGFWLTVVSVNPTLCATLLALTETALALCFLLGIFTNAASIVGIVLSLAVWSIPEGFGGPYIAGQTVDIGTAFPYAILCALLLCTSAGCYYGLDNRLAPRLKRFSFLSSQREKVSVNEERHIEIEYKKPPLVEKHEVVHKR